MSKTANYTYDSTGRLTKAIFNNGSQAVYNFDAVGNRTSTTTQAPSSPGSEDPSTSQLRISLTAGDPWGLSSVSNGGTLYIEPIYDKRIGLWNVTTTVEAKVNAFSLSLAGKAAQNYRLYVWDSNGDQVVDSAELVPWINSFLPPADITVEDGYLVSGTYTARRAVADVYLHAAGQCDWREARRGICHIDERSRRTATLSAFPSEDTWDVPRNTNVWRPIGGGSGALGEHFVEFILSGTTLVCAESAVVVERDAGSGTYKYEFGFGLDVTTANSANQQLGHDQSVGNVLTQIAMSKYKANTTAGKHALTMIEKNSTSRDVTAYGDNNLSPAVFKTGMIAEVLL